MLEGLPYGTKDFPLLKYKENKIKECNIYLLVTEYIDSQKAITLFKLMMAAVVKWLRCLPLNPGVVGLSPR